ncbi:uncharacterized protein LOC131846693 [Achroia grisella]|uniref:uncharacterized protein LOC131846693 n=1 Tax=Achroia grisella TaxID=688607 RepID=UPI0027D2D038|nr:uncharacterized protein LOC131846693 [Achroia grisella]
MKVKHLCLLLVAAVASTTAVVAQSEDELLIPEENNNQFPPEDQPEEDGDIIQGSGNGAIAEPADPITSTTELSPPIEEVQSNTLLSEGEITPNDETLCPDICLCNFEGSEFVTDCSSLDLTELPNAIDPKTTKLKIQNNKLTEIPKEVSLLNNVNFLNASNNLIMNLAPGSISELQELAVLDLSNNRLIEYPTDLKNGFALTKLTDLTLGGNDMRTSLEPETLTKFTSLQNLVLPSTLNDLQTKITCKSLNNLVASLCIESCEKESYDCSNTLDDNDLAVIPGAIYSDNHDQENPDSDVNEISDDERITSEIVGTSDNDEIIIKNGSSNSMRSSVVKGPIAASPQNSIVDTAPQETPSKQEPNDPNISATTAENNNGGVNKSVIGLIVAGMVVVIAGITVKKNWNSIKKRFSSNSNSRTPNERPTSDANNSTPEEIPLQDKSPV